MRCCTEIKGLIKTYQGKLNVYTKLREEVPPLSGSCSKTYEIYSQLEENGKRIEKDHARVDHLIMNEDEDLKVLEIIATLEDLIGFMNAQIQLLKEVK